MSSKPCEPGKSGTAAIHTKGNGLARGNEFYTSLQAALQLSALHALILEDAFPKRYNWNTNEPLLYPFEGVPTTNWDFAHFNPKFF